MKEYAIYRGEMLLSIGTAEECAEELGLSTDYIRWLMTPTAKKRLAKLRKPERSLTGVVLDDDGEDF